MSKSFISERRELDMHTWIKQGGACRVGTEGPRGEDATSVMFQVMGHQRLPSRVVHLPNRQRTMGTRRVRQLEHVRARAYTLGTPHGANLQAKRDRHCPAVSASTAT